MLNLLQYRLSCSFSKETVLGVNALLTGLPYNFMGVEYAFLV